MATRQMKWLVACECSGIVRDALIARGHQAISCDLKPTQRPGPHLPVCRIMANSGVRWLYKGGRKENEPQRWRDLEAAVKFYLLFCNATHIPLRAVENPIMHEYAAALAGHRADQFVHPWWFGSPFQKATGFRLYGLRPLPQEFTRQWYVDRSIPIEQKVWRMGPSPDREEKRSETDPQIARAMAQYWGSGTKVVAPRSNPC